jgi:putative methyltransferase (TIGR04325 family)
MCPLDATPILKALREVTPPAIWKAARRLRDRAVRHGLVRAEWQALPGGWPEADADPSIVGWDHPSVAQIQRRNWSTWKRAIAAPGAVGCAYETPASGRDRLDTHDANLGLAYAALLAARGRDTLSVLDWGSGPGHAVELLRSLCPHLGLDYHGRDLPGLVALGRELVPDARFHDDDACLDRRYELVIASGSLSYARDWPDMLGRLARATAGWLLIARQPITMEASYLFLQRPHAFGYRTAYAGWCIRRDDLVAAATAAGLELARDMITEEARNIIGAPSPCHVGALLFRRPLAA